MNLVDAFNDTRLKSKEKYALYTNCLATQTRVYTEEDLNNLSCKQTNVIVQYVISDTVKYILDSVALKKRAALNFADGYEKGGLVLQGATTQEECLCRSSNLYESLCLDECEREYYSYNRDNKEFNRGNCSDRLIYTDDVLFFKDSELEDIESINEHNFCDIITCPAPIYHTATDVEIMKRMENIIKVASTHYVNELILGAWGCGAFGNNLEHFLTMWEAVIYRNRYVPVITFAFLEPPTKDIQCTLCN